MTKLRKEAREISEALIYAASITEPPISFDGILDWIKDSLEFKLTIINSKSYLADNGLSGKIIRKGKDVFIMINQNDPEARRRFTLAHELGHLLEGVSDAYMSQAMPDGYDKERFADVFASELLMPADFVEREWSKLSITHELPIVQYKLAQLFNVSNEAMGYRLNELNLQSRHWAGTEIPPVYK